ncbi:MAG TPA: porin [Sutterella sp.]|nr:porin [Sutterella sp.]
MKKIAVAVAAALLAGSAAAADVTLYGVIDTGFSYTNTRSKAEGSSSKLHPDKQKQAQSTKSFSMDSGNSAGSRWGLKGSEDLGNGLKVGFVLESGFKSDTGAQKDDDRLFNRQAFLSVSGDFGTVYAGRMYSLISDAGASGWYGAMASPFGSGWGQIAGHEAVMHMQGGKDNTLIYMSPRFSGFQFSAQYSMGGEGKENKPSTDRYAAIGVDYQAGGLEIGFLVDWMNKDSSELNYGEDLAKVRSDATNIDKNAWTVNLAANYDCGFAKSFIAAQYFKNVSLNQGFKNNENQLNESNLMKKYLGSDFETDEALEDLGRLMSAKGYGINLGVDIPVFGGNAMLSVGYEDADLRVAKRKIASVDVYSVLAGYTYPISKRTSVYAGAGYTYNKLKGSANTPRIGSASGKIEGSIFQAMAGLKHTF